MVDNLKIVAATLVVVGILIGLYNLKNQPHHLLLESSPNRPGWLPWLSWGVTSGAAVLYIVLDFCGSS